MATDGPKENRGSDQFSPTNHNQVLTMFFRHGDFFALIHSQDGHHDNTPTTPITKRIKVWVDNKMWEQLHPIERHTTPSRSVVSLRFLAPFPFADRRIKSWVGSCTTTSRYNKSRAPNCLYKSIPYTRRKKNYSTTEKEWLAIVWAFTKSHPYLHGTHVKVETEHQPLIHLTNKPQPPSRLLRWAMALHEYRSHY